MTDPTHEESAQLDATVAPPVLADVSEKEPASSAPGDAVAGAFDRVALVAVIIALAALTVQWIALTRRRPAELDWERSENFIQLFQVDVNTADWVEWIQLEGIGHKTAHRIVLDREQNGLFATIDDLQRVHGIGPVTLDAIRPWLIISHDSQHSSEHSRNENPQSTNQQPTAF